MPSPDIFDQIKLDVFDDIESDRFKPNVEPPRMAVKMTDEIRAEIRAQVRAQVASEVAAITKELKPVTKVIEKTIYQPEKTIVKEAVDNTEAILKKVEKRLKKEVDDLDRSGRFGPIVVPSPIADQTGQGGKVLSTDGRLTKWITAASGGGSVSPDSYTPNNVTTTRTFDATLTSLDELANVVGSLITSLKGAGIVQ